MACKHDARELLFFSNTVSSFRDVEVFSPPPPPIQRLNRRASGQYQAVRDSPQAALFGGSSRSIRAASSLRAFCRLRSLEGLSRLAEWLI